MKKPSLSFELEGYLRARDSFIHSVELEDFARSLGFKASNSGRRLREMYDAGLIEREYRLHDGVRVVWYRFKQPVASNTYSHTAIGTDRGVLMPNGQLKMI